jgi:hypothetical protein
MTLERYLHRAKIAPRLIQIAEWCKYARVALVTQNEAVRLLKREWSRRGIRAAIVRLRGFGVRVTKT